MTWLMKILGKGNKSKRGFTLIELMVVVIVVGILAAAAVPIYRFAMSRAYSSEAKATIGTIRSSELVYYTEQNPNAYLSAQSTEDATTDLMVRLGVDTTTNTWWHSGSNDDSDTCTFGFGLKVAALVLCSKLPTADMDPGYYIYVKGTDVTSPINGIEMALDITTGTWYHYWP